MNKTTKPRNDFEALTAQLEINEDNIDNDIVRLPVLFFQVSDQVVFLSREYSDLKARLDEMCVSCAQLIRAEADKDGKKVTETAVKEKVEADAGVIKLDAQLREAKHALERWQALKEAYSQKSYSLRALVDLTVAQYRQRSSMSAASDESGQRARTAMSRSRLQPRAHTR